MWKLILALITVESGGNNKAVGDNGQAYGALQIHISVVQDVNRIYGTTYKYRDRYSRQVSAHICQLYLMHYASRKRLGREPTYQDMARIWNGGPNGYKKNSTLNYWRKVRLHL